MNQQTISHLVSEVLKEENIQFGSVFDIDHVINKAGVWGVLVSDAQGFFALSLNIQTHNTEASLKDEIRRQVLGNRPR